ncbi:MAG: response regulator [Cyanobacteria bacterium P01_G01_bin.38]
MESIISVGYLENMPVTVLDLDKRLSHTKEHQFTGILSVEAEATAPWHLYFLAGQIVWANTQAHPKRRWHRQLVKHCPELIQQNHRSSQKLTYNALAKLVIHKKFDRQRFSELVAGCISEVLFDIIQQGSLKFQTSRKLLTYKAQSQDPARFPYVGLQCVYPHVWRQVQQDWEKWQRSGLSHILPNQAPIIEQPTKLKEQTSPAMFQALMGLLDGQQSFRDLALRVKQPLLPLTLSVLPHVQKESIRVVDVDDCIAAATSAIGAPPSPQTSAISATQPQRTVTPNQPLSSAPPHKIIPKAGSHGQPMVAYIDDNPADSQAMRQIVQAAGCQYTNIADPMQALLQLLELKPQLIFLDLVMPVANGYEVCAQIRRISAFKDTPIIIVTNNDGIADRVRAKVVGASGFLGKPINQQRVLKVLKRYLKISGKPSSSVQRTLNFSPPV